MGIIAFLTELQPVGPEDEEMIYDSDSISGNVIVTPGDLIVQAGSTSGFHGIAGKRGYNSSKRYFEFQYDTLVGSKQVMVGIEPAPFSFDFPVTGGCAFRAWDRRMDHSGASHITDGAATSATDIIGVAIDFDNLKGFWALNNNWVSYTAENSNPVTGVDPLFDLAADTYYYPSTLWYYNNSTIELRPSGFHQYTAPSGYSAW